MATPVPSNSFLNDSLEAGNSWQRKRFSVVEPIVNTREEVDQKAFSAEDVVFGPFPSHVVNLLQDANNWKNRTSGVTKMQSIISELPSDYSLESHLEPVLKLATSTLSDNHFKVTQLGLELIACIVAKAGKSIRPFLSSLVQGIMGKVGSNKFVLKQAGLQVLKELMVALRPTPVINEIMEFGDNHKLSRVREETLNAISVAILTFPKSEFDFSSILKKTIPSMCDNKPRVRQASFETVALICNIEPAIVEETVTEIVSQRDAHKAKYCAQNGLTLMVAFQTRLARRSSGVPKLNSSGLIEYSIPISSSKTGLIANGDDVQWILAAGGTKSQSSGDVSEVGDGSLLQSAQRKGSLTNGVPSSSRPYRSAGKRLPWEIEGEELIRNHLTMPVKELAPLSNPPSPKHLPFNPLSESPSVLPNPRKKTYSDMYLAKKASQKPLAAIQATPSAGGNWGLLSSANDRVAPLFTPRHASVSDDQSTTATIQPNSSMSVTWPRSGGGVALSKVTNQITADTSKITGVNNSVKTSVSRPLSKPRVRNPLHSIKASNQSKAHRESPTQLEKEFLSSANGVSDGINVPTGWAETSWDDEYFNTIPEDVTILNSSLSSSLSSLCAGKSDIDGTRDITTDIDKLKHIRREAASRKAQLLSACTSVSNSPEASRQSSGETKRQAPNQEMTRRHFSSQGEGLGTAPIRKLKRPKPLPQHPGLNSTFSGSSRWLSEDSPDPAVSLSKTYNPAGSENTYTAAYAAKKLTTPLKSFKSSHSQKDCERLLAEGSKVISSEDSSSDTFKSSYSTKKARKNSNGSLGDMVDGENTSQVRPVELSVKAQSAGYSSLKKPPLPPTTIENNEPSTSAPPERKRSKHKKTSPPQKQKVDKTSPPLRKKTDKTSPPLRRKTDKTSPPLRRKTDMHDRLDASQNGSPEGSSQDLHPFHSPETGLQDSMQGLDSEDWSIKVEGIIGIKRLAIYHPDILLPQLHAVIFAVVREVKNLRSSVARAAIACFGDLFATMGSAMEKDLEKIVKVLLHKGMESNAFIRDDLEKTLEEMVVSVSHHKCLIALINGGLSHRSIQVRRTTAKYICLILESQGPSKFLHSSKDLDRTLSAIVQLAADNSADARYFGKRCLHQLWPLADFDRISARVLSTTLYNKAKEVVDILRAKGLGDPPIENHSAKSRHSTGSTIRASSNKPLPPTEPEPISLNSTRKTRRLSSISGPPEPLSTAEVPLPDGLLNKLRSGNWSERLEGVTELEDFVNNYPKALGPHLLKVFDLFCPRLTDRNSKVNLKALEVFSNIVPLLCDTLTPVVTNIVTALVPNLASRNATIHSNAMTALDLLTQCIDPSYLIQPVANSGQFGNARVRPIMISKLADLTLYISDQKPQLVVRQVLPVLWYLVSAKAPLTGDTRSAAVTLCEALSSALGMDTLIESASQLSPEAYKKLDDLISSQR